MAVHFRLCVKERFDLEVDKPPQAGRRHDILDSVGSFGTAPAVG